MDSTPDVEEEIDRRKLVHAGELRAMGVPAPQDGWLLGESYRDELGIKLVDLIKRYRRERPLEDGMPAEVARQTLGLPDPALLSTILHSPAAAEVSLRSGRLRLGAAQLPERVHRALRTIRETLATAPFTAPTAAFLARLGLGEKELAAAAREGELLRIAPGLVLLPDAESSAVRRLSELPDPFTVSQARRTLGTSRRVAVPLLEFLARRGHTQRLPDGTHRVISVNH